MPEILRTLIAILLLPVALFSFTSMQWVLWLLVPGPLSAIGKVVARGRGRCLIAGLGATAVGLFLISALSQRGRVADMLAAMTLGLLALGALAGLTAVVGLLGQSALETAGRSNNRASSVVVGSLLFVGAGLFPIVGWALAFYFLLIGLGGALLSLIGSRRHEKHLPNPVEGAES